VVVRGEMRILAHPVDRLSSVVAGLRTGLQEALNGRSNIGQKGEITDVVFLSYLGDNENEALSGHAVGQTGVGASDRGNFGFLEGNATGGDDKQQPLGLIFGLSGVVATVLAAAFFTSKRRLAGTTAGFRELDHPSPRCRVGTGDPPGSFHDGLYHYMRHGKRYLSTRCEECLNTKRNSIYTVDVVDSSTFANGTLETIREYETYDANGSLDDVLLRADSGLGLSKHHMGMNVHKCNSATCKLCSPDSPQTIFVPLPVVPESQSGGSTATSYGTQSSLTSTQHSLLTADMFSPTSTGLA
jgi:hypothetical protein